MAALLRILSNAEDGTAESLIIPIENVLQFRIVVKEADTLSAENVVENNDAEEAPEATQPVPEDGVEESKLTLIRTDGTEQEIDAMEKHFLFEIRDEEGEIIVSTDNLYKLEEGFLIAHIISEKTRQDKVKALLQKK